MGPKPKNLIKAIGEGILGYMLYQSRCGIQEAYSEYLLYDPIVRISKDKNWAIESEFSVDSKKGKGDKQRIDFLCSSSKDKTNLRIGLEIKFLKTGNSQLDLKKDKDKLNSLNDYVDYTKLYGFIVIAGNHSKINVKKIEKLRQELDLTEYFKCTFENQFKKSFGVTVLKVIEKINK
ncbi:MAG TPA: hypothetical protein PKV39_02490 [bacterium]|nr:hypothetical protein [bacterium]